MRKDNVHQTRSCDVTGSNGATKTKKMNNYGSCCKTVQVSASATHDSNNNVNGIFNCRNCASRATFEKSSSGCFPSHRPEVDDATDANDEQIKNNTTLLQRAAKRIPGLGIMFALCASLFLGSAGMLVKLTQSVHGIQIAVLRACIQLIIYGIIITCRRIKPVPVGRTEWFAVLGRAIPGAISITFSYCCLRLIPLGDATTIRFSLPIWTLIISYFLLGEPCSLIKVCAVIVSVSGVVMIAKPDDCIWLFHLLFYNLNLESRNEYLHHKDDYKLAQEREFQDTYASVLSSSNSSDQLVTMQTGNIVGTTSVASQALLDEAKQKHFEGCLMALASSICLSLSLISLRFSKRTPVEVSILWLSIACILVGTVTLLVLDEWNLPDNLRDVLYILLNGLCGAIGQWFITSALKIEQSGMIALARTFDIEVAFLYSALLLHEQIRATSVIGSVLVSGGVVAVVVSKLIASRTATKSSDKAADPPEVPGPNNNNNKQAAVYANIRIKTGEEESAVQKATSETSQPGKQWRRHSANNAAAKTKRRI